MECLLFGFMGMPGWMEILVIVAVGLLLFGRRLPDLARSAGSSIVEFRRAMRDEPVTPPQGSTNPPNRAQ